MSNDEIRIGPITRARAKLLNKQVNSLLTESDVLLDDNFILPKSMHLCMIGFEEETSMARGEEEQNMMIVHGCAREEREEGATQEEEIITKQKLKLSKTAGLCGLHAPDYPACTGVSGHTSTGVSGGAYTLQV